MLCSAACTVLGTAFGEANHCLQGSEAQYLEQLGCVACPHACSLASSQVRC